MFAYVQLPVPRYGYCILGCVHAQVSSIGEWTFDGENGGVPKVDIIIC
jgi:hypothetical protein